MKWGQREERSEMIALGLGWTGISYISPTIVSLAGTNPKKKQNEMTYNRKELSRDFDARNSADGSREMFVWYRKKKSCKTAVFGFSRLP